MENAAFKALLCITDFKTKEAINKNEKMDYYSILVLALFCNETLQLNCTNEQIDAVTAEVQRRNCLPTIIIAIY